MTELAKPFEMLGKPFSDAIVAGNATKAGLLRERGIVPRLAIVRVGNSGDDYSYEQQIIKRAPLSGIEALACDLDGNISQTDLEDTIRKLSADRKIHGIILMRPLPKRFDEASAIACIDPAKDIDGATDQSKVFLYSGRGKGFYPCTAEAAVLLLKYYGIKLEGTRAAVVGRSETVGKAAALLLLKENATVTVCHSRTEDLAAVLKDCDVVVAAAGRAKLVTGECLREGAAVVDVGYNILDDGTVSGDVDFDAAWEKKCAVTPVPRGLGNATVAVLMRHLIRACEEEIG